MPSIAPRRLALLGLMGAGKTALGRELAARLRWPFLDSDRLLEERSGNSVADLFAAEGEAGFRERERALLEELATAPPPLVLATGGGIVESPPNRKRLAKVFWGVWLRVDPSEAVRRLEGDTTRPLLGEGDPASILRDLAAHRASLYAEVARLVVEAHLPLEALADAVLEALAAPSEDPENGTL